MKTAPHVSASVSVPLWHFYVIRYAKPGWTLRFDEPQISGFTFLMDPKIRTGWITNFQTLSHSLRFQRLALTAYRF